MVSVWITTLLLLSISADAFAQTSRFLEPGGKDVANASSTPKTQPESGLPKLTSEQRGDVYMARKMYREAIDTYSEGPKESALTWNKVGIAYHQLGNYSLARKNYEKAVKLDAKYADAINNVGTVLYAQKRYRSAIGKYKKALDLSPKSASIWGNLGTAYYARSKYDDMFQCYKTALELDPMVFEHRNSFGAILQERTVTDRARYHFELARMYAHTGRNELALQYLRKSLEEGFKDRNKLNEAPEFAAIRKLPEFAELLALEPRVL